MNWIDDITAILSDSTILNFDVNGNVVAFFSKDWKRSFKTNTFEHQTKERAIKIWEEVDKLLQDKLLQEQNILLQEQKRLKKCLKNC